MTVILNIEITPMNILSSVIFRNLLILLYSVSQSLNSLAGFLISAIRAIKALPLQGRDLFSTMFAGWHFVNSS